MARAHVMKTIILRTSLAMANKVSLQSLKAKEKVLQEEIENLRSVQKGKEL